MTSTGSSAIAKLCLAMSGLLVSLVILTKLRFENNSNKKTLKLAWRFFLLNYLFVTSAGFAGALPLCSRLKIENPIAMQLILFLLRTLESLIQVLHKNKNPSLQ
ncbi:hypothetical protein L0P88_16275 [Muricauda sp. SCSIO 64092]|uniref:hypothetical protein n=1 Tax=Allomuricauda sp. SCSIO 64092 TaxID=2908842 RepID=UPI001FF6E31A|nr:hypothetical protein [Muricauda sp. SCSIO 64092]UOY05501.1 hypothetical protein L0P88_16275 [Muricauda sp. SCSIO 64092]